MLELSLCTVTSKRDGQLDESVSRDTSMQSIPITRFFVANVLDSASYTYSLRTASIMVLVSSVLLASLEEFEIRTQRNVSPTGLTEDSIQQLCCRPNNVSQDIRLGVLARYEPLPTHTSGYALGD